MDIIKCEYEICNSQGYSFAGAPTEERTGGGECLPICNVFATSIESVDIKSVICGRINCNEKLYGGAPDPSDSILVM